MIKEHKPLNSPKLFDKLSKMGEEGNALKEILKFLHKPYAKEAIDEMNSKHETNGGASAYDRIILLSILLYGFYCKVNSWKEIDRHIRLDKVLDTILDIERPCTETLKNFLKENKRKLFKILFVGTLVQLNDEKLIKFLNFFIDGTSAIVNGSRFYKFYRDEIKAYRLVKSYGLLHSNTPRTIALCKNGLERKLKSLEKLLDNENKKNKNLNKNIDEDKVKEKIELIKLALGRLKLYNKRFNDKINLFEKIMDERDIDYVSINFPRGVMMKTKKEIFDFALNLQSVMNLDKIIMSLVLTETTNDKEVLAEALNDIKETFEIFLEIQKKHGERYNYKEIENALEEAIWICDSGYYTMKNLMTADDTGYNFVIMTPAISRDHNRELKEKDPHNQNKPKDYEDVDKITKYDAKRVRSGFICPRGNKIELIESKPVNHRKKFNDDREKEIKYYYKCNSCEGCPYQDKCNLQEFKVSIPELKYNMTQKVAHKTYQKIYAKRFSASESINGYFKGTKGILYLLSPNLHCANNEILLRAIVYNLFRRININNT